MRYKFPTGYTSRLNARETVNAINDVKYHLRQNFHFQYTLLELTPPLFVKTKSGINKDALSLDRPINFDIKATDDVVEYFTSLDKWTRYALYKYDIKLNSGIICEHRSVKRDINLSNTHSILIDETAIELSMRKENKNLDNLIFHCKKLYENIRRVDTILNKKYMLVEKTKDEVLVFTTQQLENMYPALSPQERELRVARKHGPFFLIGTGTRLNSGSTHSTRPFDVQDLSLTAELIVNIDVLMTTVSVATIGFKVDLQTLIDQASISGNSEKMNTVFHRLIQRNKIPTSLGIKVFNSRLNLWLLEKVHIAEVQHSVWSSKFEEFLVKNNIDTL